MKSLKITSVIILVAVFVMAAVLICLGDDVIHPSDAPKLKDWTVELIEQVRYYPVAGAYAGKMSDEDCEAIWKIWDKYEHKDGAFENESDVFFRINKDSNQPEFFEYDDRESVIQYCRIKDYNNWDVNTRTYAFISEEDKAAFLEIIEKYRSELVKWTLDIEAVRESGVNQESYEFSHASIEAFSDVWNRLRHRQYEKYISIPGYKEIPEEEIEGAVKDQPVLFTITLQNTMSEESYFRYYDKGMVLEYAEIWRDSITGKLDENHEYYQLVPSALEDMWRIIKDYTGVVEHNIYVISLRSVEK